MRRDPTASALEHDLPLEVRERPDLERLGGRLQVPLEPERDLDLPAAVEREG